MAWLGINRRFRSAQKKKKIACEDFFEKGERLATTKTSRHRRSSSFVFVVVIGSFFRLVVSFEVSVVHDDGACSGDVVRRCGGSNRW